MAPLTANSDDPLEVARQQIQQLDIDIKNLTNQTKTQELIDLAKQKYNIAVSSKSAKDSAQLAYDNSVTAESAALSAKNIAQENVNIQQPIRDNAYQTLQTKQSAYESAQIAYNAYLATTGTGGAQGVSFRIYPLSRYSDGTAYLSSNAGLICQGSIPTFYTYAGSGAICGASQNIIGIFRATLTIPDGINDVYFAGYTDDGFKLFIDGQLATSQWIEQGATWSPYTRHYDVSVDKTLDLEVWWYNGGGPGSIQLGWGYNGIWTSVPYGYQVPSGVLTYGTPLSSEQQTHLNELKTDMDTKYISYQSALNDYNTENIKLNNYNSTLTSAINTYDNTVITKNIAYSNLTTANTNYNTAISEMQTAIKNAQDEYTKQAKFEEEQRVAAAIAQALANQPQPSPEPSIAPTTEPTIEPTVEPTTEPTTNPIDEPTTEPTVDPTSEPTLSPEPTIEPTPEITVEPTVEPTIEPTISSTTNEIIKTENQPVSSEMSNLIADLTSSNTLTKLTTEQKQAVAHTLGINATEITKVAELAKSDPAIAEALQEFGTRANENLNAPMPYTLADATTEIQAEQFLADPLGAIFDINPMELLSNFSELGMDMTDDQREKTQEVVIPVIIVSNIASAVIAMRR